MEITNEQICKLFKSQFELVNHAIRLAGNRIMAGHEGIGENVVSEVLFDIQHGRDLYQDLEEEEEEEEEEEGVIISIEESAPPPKSRMRTLAKK